MFLNAGAAFRGRLAKGEPTSAPLLVAGFQEDVCR